MEETLKIFVKWSIVELCCNSEMENRGECVCKEKPSNLKENMRLCDNNFERAIDQVIRNLCQEEKYKTLLRNYLLSKDVEDDEDEANYWAFEDFFNFIVGEIGLHQIDSLHADSRDYFQSKLKELIV